MRLSPSSPPRVYLALLAITSIALVSRGEATTALAATASFLAGEPIVAGLSATPDVGSAAASATVTSDSGSGITERGFVFALTSDDPAPTLGAPNVKVVHIAPGVGPMKSAIPGASVPFLPHLVPNTTYSIQGYATNANGTGYTGPKSFTTKPCPVLTIDPLPQQAALGADYFPTHWVNGHGGSGIYSFGLVGAPPGLGLAGNYNDTFFYFYGSPSAVGSFDFTITIEDIRTGCTGFRDYSIVVDSLSVNPRQVAFASQIVSTPSTPKAVNIYNPNGVDVALSFAFTGPFSQDSTDCVDPLPANSSCTMNVVYTPTAAVAQTGSLIITHDQPVSPLVVPLSGAGTATAVPQLYVANQDYYHWGLSVIDPVTNVVRTSILGIGRPGNLAALPGGAKIYVPDSYYWRVNVIDTATNIVTPIDDGSFYGPFALAPTPSGNEVWVLNSYDGSITVIDTSTDTVVTNFGDPCASEAEGIVANPVTHEMYVLNPNNGRVCVFDRTTRSFAGEIILGGGPRHGVVLPDGSALYVNSATGGAAARISLPSRTVTYIANAGGQGMDMTADGSKVYIARSDRGFGVIHTSTNTFTNIPLTGNTSASGVAVDEAVGRVYVTDEGDGSNAPNWHVSAVDLSTDTEVVGQGLPIYDGSLGAPTAIARIKPAAVTGTIPVVSGQTATPATVSALVGANITDDGGLAIFERGFFYSVSDTDPLPGNPGVLTQVVSGGPFSTTLTGLASGATYYFRGYAKNTAGTGVSPVGTFDLQSCSDIELDPSSLPSGLAGTAYSQLFSASGSAGSYVFSATGNLPPGVTFSVDTISGTPLVGGDFTLDVTATDPATGCFASRTYDLVVGSTPAKSDVVISEFRTRGPNGSTDEYVELGNRTSADIVVMSTDGSGGWSVGRSGESVAFIPDGTLIPRGGHWLAVGASFSLASTGYPSPLSSDANLLTDLPDDNGVALFTTANPALYCENSRLDSVGTVLDIDPLFYEGSPLPEVVQYDGSSAPIDPTAQTAWVRRLSDNGTISDGNSNDRDFVFVATDGGDAYGPGGNVHAILGGPNPEDSGTVHDALQSELSASLLDLAWGPQQYPNRQVYTSGNVARAIEYRRVYTNNTEAPITGLAFKVTNLTTKNVHSTIAQQADLRLSRSFNRTLSDSYNQIDVDVSGTDLDSPMYPLYTNGFPGGGLNSRVVVSLGGGGGGAQPEVMAPGAQAPGCVVGIAPGDSIAVNLAVQIQSRGYYLFTVIPQITDQIPGPPKRSEIGTAGVRNKLRAESLCSPPKGGLKTFKR